MLKSYELRIRKPETYWDDIKPVYQLRAESLGEYLYLVFEYQGGPTTPIQTSEVRVNEIGNYQGHYFRMYNGKPINPPQEYYTNRYRNVKETA